MNAASAAGSHRRWGESISGGGFAPALEPPELAWRVAAQRLRRPARQTVYSSSSGWNLDGGGLAGGRNGMEFLLNRIPSLALPAGL